MDKENYEKRKQKSRDMLNNGVELVKHGFNEYYIPSQIEKDKRYKVTINKGWYSCECADNK
jgi:ABC-type xylose transport system substrate-binding protein